MVKPIDFFYECIITESAKLISDKRGKMVKKGPVVKDIGYICVLLDQWLYVYIHMHELFRHGLIWFGYQHAYQLERVKTILAKSLRSI